MPAPHAAFPVRSFCRVLCVSRSGDYEWLGRAPRAHPEVDQQVQDTVQGYFAQGRGPYGTRRLKHLLTQEGLQVSRRRIGRVLAQAGLHCRAELVNQAWSMARCQRQPTAGVIMHMDRGSQYGADS